MNKHYKTLELHKIMDMLAEQAGNDETLRMISEQSLKRPRTHSTFR